MPWYSSGGAVVSIALLLLYLAWVGGTVKRNRRERVLASEIQDARELHRVLTQKHESDKRFASRWARWAPGDYTRYTVLHVVAYPDGFDVAGQIHCLIFSVGTDKLIVPRFSGMQRWTPEEFLRMFGEKYAGWWAGVRPVLAAFGWTSTRADDLAYSSRDAEEIGALLSSEG